MEIKQLEALGEGIKAMRDAHDGVLAEVKKNGTALGDTMAKLTAAQTRLDAIEDAIQKGEVVKELETKFGKEIERLETLTKRLDQTKTGDDEATLLTKAEMTGFDKLLRKADSKISRYREEDGFTSHEVKALTALQTKAATTLNGPAGGYLVPLEYVQALLDRNLVEQSLLRSICMVRRTSNQSVVVSTHDGKGTATWVGETDTRPETRDQRFGQVTINTHTQYCQSAVSDIDLEDSSVDVPGLIRNDFGVQMGNAENLSFISGTGVGQPRGFLTHSAVPTYNMGDATELTAEGIIGATFALKEFYLPNARFVYSRRTARKIRLLKDGEGRFLWVPSLDQLDRKQGPTLVGFPVTNVPHMPDPVADAFPIAFGDFSQAYWIVDRLALQITVDPFRLKSQGMIEYSGRRRVGGDVVVPEAILKLKVSADANTI